MIGGISLEPWTVSMRPTVIAVLLVGSIATLPANAQIKTNPPSPEAVAASAVRQLFELTSRTDGQAMTWLSGHYADDVLYSVNRCREPGCCVRRPPICDAGPVDASFSAQKARW